MYFALQKCYPTREQYGDTLLFCRHCSTLFWKVSGGGRGDGGGEDDGEAGSLLLCTGRRREQTGSCLTPTPGRAGS